jgi:hypothetical protein
MKATDNACCSPSLTEDRELRTHPFRKHAAPVSYPTIDPDEAIWPEARQTASKLPLWNRIVCMLTHGNHHTMWEKEAYIHGFRCTKCGMETEFFDYE